MCDALRRSRIALCREQHHTGRNGRHLAASLNEIGIVALGDAGWQGGRFEGDSKGIARRWTPEFAGTAPMRGYGFPPTITAASIVPCFSRSIAALASRLSASTLMLRALKKAATVAAELLPTGPKLTFLPARSATLSISVRART